MTIAEANAAKYGATPVWYLDTAYRVHSVKGDRAIIQAPNGTGGVWTVPVKALRLDR